MAGLRFQSTLSMRRATLRGHVDRVVQPISIHALHEESDLRSHRAVRGVSISIHALHEESDHRMQHSGGIPVKFQSTLSMRRATRLLNACRSMVLFQSTLSMRRATAPITNMVYLHVLFQSTLSMRRATPRAGCKARLDAISIHALHEESDR